MIEHELVREQDDDRAPTCPTCGGDLEWIECDECDGTGETAMGLLHDCDPLWYDVQDTAPCHICEGASGHYACTNSREWCEAHVTQGHGFSTTTPDGHAMHVNGARDMSDEDLAVIGELADLAYKQVARQRGWKSA